MLPSLPTCLVFGYQTSFGSRGRLDALHDILSLHYGKQFLISTFQDLESTWNTLISHDIRVCDQQTYTWLKRLQDWSRGGAYPDDIGSMPNAIALPLTVLSHAALYVDYLDQVNELDPHRRILSSVQKSGIQGFCVGLLTAISVALAVDEFDMISYLSTSLRLSLCMGAIIDAQEKVAKLSSGCIAVRWNDEANTLADIERIMHDREDAYITSFNDSSCITICSNTHELESLRRDFHTKNIHVKSVDVHGRFHNSLYANAASRLNALCNEDPRLQLPPAGKLKVPVRSTSTGEQLVAQPLHQVVINDIMLQPIKWFTTMTNALSAGQTPNHHIISLGIGRNIPRTIVMRRDVRILDVDDVSSCRSTLPANTTSSTGSTFNDFTPRSSNLQVSDHHSETAYPADSIAVVGMACRFPGAESTEEFWRLLTSGSPMVRPVPLERFPLATSRLSERTDIQWWGNFLDDADAFDHKFFKKSAREVLSWDPAKRQFMEVVYQALESAGHFGIGSQGHQPDYGVYLGAVANNYYDNVSCHPPTAYSMLGSARGFFSGQISHHFGFTGPAMTVDTACSSSLVAINAACKAILSGECSRAVAGGTNVFTSPFDYQNLGAAGFLSPTGACKPFDASADGYCRGEGVAAVILKSVATAIAEGDNILGIIAGSVVNQNYNNTHITVPCAESQSNVFQKVLQQAKIRAEDVTYIEAHGTGTQVGDPIECQSIRQTFGGSNRHDKLYFGSVKGLIGHTEATAGVAGLVKVLLMMQKGTIPSQAGFSTLNPKILPLEPDRMQLASSTRSWDVANRIAFVNSYGAAGSNAAVAVFAAKNNAQENPWSSSQTSYPVLITASSEKSLVAYSQHLLNFLREPDNHQYTISDITFNLADRANHSFTNAIAETVTSLADLEDKLQAAVADNAVLQRAIRTKVTPVILVFSGQERDMIGLSSDIYQSCDVFRQHLHDCNNALQALCHKSLFPAIFQDAPIEDLSLLHACLFSVQYACAKSWMDCGIVPQAMVGHSFGQLTAICVSGYLSLLDTIRLVVGRADIILEHWGTDKGSMISIQGDIDAVTQFISSMSKHAAHDLPEIACYNRPDSVVVAGSTASIDILEGNLAESAVPVKSKRLMVTHGYHSRLTEPILPALKQLAADLTWRTSAFHLELCTERGTQGPVNAELVVSHMRQPVYFNQAISRLVDQYPSATWLEAGPGSSILTLVQNCLPLTLRSGHKFHRSSLTVQSTNDALVNSTVELWRAGHQVQHWAFHRSQKIRYQHVPLPPYQFEKHRHWLPFVERSVEIDQPVSNLQAEISHEFISQLPSTGSDSLFSVDPQSERYISLLTGHVASGQALAPVSIYIELLSRAMLMLKDNAAISTHIGQIANLEMRSPIGLDVSRDLQIQLSQHESGKDSWNFAISSRKREGQPNSMIHSTGQARLVRRTDSELKQMYKQYSALVGMRRPNLIFSDEDTEMMQGKHIYRAISKLIDFHPMYQGIKVISCLGHEAAARVKASPNTSLGDYRIYDTPVLDSFMQIAGILVNYFTHPAKDDVLVCQRINRISMGPDFNIDAHEWTVYALLSEDTGDYVECDVYVVDTSTQRVVFQFLGFCFTKISTSILAKSLSTVNGSAPSSVIIRDAAEPSASPVVNTSDEHLSVVRDDSHHTQDHHSTSHTTVSRKNEVIALLHRVTDIPVEEIDDQASLEELGIDSLMVTEVLTEIRQTFVLNIDLDVFLNLPNVVAVCTFICGKLGSQGAPVDAELPRENECVKNLQQQHRDNLKLHSLTTSPTLTRVHEKFDHIRTLYDSVAEETGAINFWRDCYPDQAALVLAYVVEAFAELGCDLHKSKAGDIIPDIEHLLKHDRLVQQLQHILADGGLVKPTLDGKHARTDKAIDLRMSSQLYADILPRYHHHADVHRITHVIGKELAACLKGEKDGLQLIFGNKESKKILENVYEHWPLVRSGTLVLAAFLKEALVHANGVEKFQILEIGAGTGGTTKYLVDFLRRSNIPFEYTFTDLSPSLVATAKKHFRDIAEMAFKVLDIEQEIDLADIGRDHIILSTNCVHATKDLKFSCSQLRKMLRPDGVLTLVEMTRNMFWLDIAVGLFEGWWLFEDGRTHALADVSFWEQSMMAAGFKGVAWSGGNSEEANTVRVIAGFNSSRV